VGVTAKDGTALKSELKTKEVQEIKFRISQNRGKPQIDKITALIDWSAQHVTATASGGQQFWEEGRQWFDLKELTDLSLPVQRNICTRAALAIGKAFRNFIDF
jgi:hypothetical protein